MNLLREKVDFFERASQELRRQGYNNNFLLTDLFDLVVPSKDISRAQIKNHWLTAVKNIREGKVRNYVNFYIHLPFCKSKCEYCMYPSRVARNKQEINTYVTSLIDQMVYYHEVFKDVKFKSLYVGGGTPSILSSDVIEKLLTNLFLYFEFENEGEKTFECNPDSVTLDKLKILKRHNINSISLGVQSLNKEVLRSENRSYQDYWQIEREVNNAKRLGFTINLDLIIGLKKANIASVFSDINQLINLRPHSICLYPLQPTRRYLKRHFSDSVWIFSKKLTAELRQLASLLRDNIEGYRFQETQLMNLRSGSPWFLLSKKKKKFRFEYSFDNFKETNCFGLGSGSCSYIFNHLRYQFLYPNLARAIHLSGKDEKIRYLLNQFSLGKNVNLANYFELFGSDLKEDFKEEFGGLATLNKAKIGKEKITFLPEGTADRFIYSLFFFDFGLVIEKYLELTRKIQDTKRKSFIFDHQCNNNCIFCWDNNRYEPIKHSEERFREQIIKILKDKPQEVAITGGEPTLHPKLLVKMVGFFSKRGIRVTLITNGRLLSNKSFVVALIRSGLRKAIIPIHGSEKTHDFITNVRGSHSQTMRGVENLIRGGVDVRVNFVCVRDNLKDILPTVKSLYASGVTTFNVQKFVAKGRGLENYNNLDFSPKVFYPYLKEISAFLQDEPKINMRFEFFGRQFFPKEYGGFRPIVMDAIKFLSESKLKKGSCYFQSKKGKAECSYCFLSEICLPQLCKQDNF